MHRAHKAKACSTDVAPMKVSARFAALLLEP